MIETHKKSPRANGLFDIIHILADEAGMESLRTQLPAQYDKTTDLCLSFRISGIDIYKDTCPCDLNQSRQAASNLTREPNI